MLNRSLNIRFCLSFFIKCLMDTSKNRMNFQKMIFHYVEIFPRDGHFYVEIAGCRDMNVEMTRVKMYCWKGIESDGKNVDIAGFRDNKISYFISLIDFQTTYFLHSLSRLVDLLFVKINPRILYLSIKKSRN